MRRRSNQQRDDKAAGSSRFLSGRAVWAELKQRSAKATSKVQAAVAYFGKDGAKQLALKAGDRLLVDMSLLAVRQGVTDPREIKKLMRKKVQVFSRERLHAKFYLIDGVLICGSANVSSRSEQVLDEAAILTRDKGAILKAKAYLNEMCSEPVTGPYLEKCLKEYQPPWFTAARGGRKVTRKSSRDAKLWFIAGISTIEIPTADQKKVDAIEEAAAEDLPDERHEVGWIRFRNKPAFYDLIKPSTWVLQCCWQGESRRIVEAPCQVLRKRTYMSSRGVKYHMLVLSVPRDGDDLGFTEFRARASKIVPAYHGPWSHSRAIVDDTSSDTLLHMWTSTGKLKGGGKA